MLSPAHRVYAAFCKDKPCRPLLKQQLCRCPQHPEGRLCVCTSATAAFKQSKDLLHEWTRKTLRSATNAHSNPRSCLHQDTPILPSIWFFHLERATSPTCDYRPCIFYKVIYKDRPCSFFIVVRQIICNHVSKI